jgi:hypothetical protein
MCSFMLVGEFGMALDPVSKQSRVMCDRLWALNTRQVLTRENFEKNENSPNHHKSGIGGWHLT